MTAQEMSQIVSFLSGVLVAIAFVLGYNKEI